MKKLFLIAATLIAGIGAMAQPKADDVIRLNADKFDFGKIRQGVPVTTYFILTNVSAAPVVIESATAGCGCTTPEYSKEPVPAGGTAKLKVGFNAASPGHFEKSVAIKLAGISETIAVSITGDVIEANNEKKEAGNVEKEAMVNVPAWRRHLENTLPPYIMNAAKSGMAARYLPGRRSLSGRKGRTYFRSECLEQSGLRFGNSG